MAAHATAARDVTCVQVAGLIARRILCYVGAGARAARAASATASSASARASTSTCRSDAEPKAAIGDKVYAAESVLAWLTAPTTKPTK